MPAPPIKIYDSNAALEQVLTHRIPTIEQLQKAVGAEPDGIWGKDSQAKWAEIICQQYADDNWPE